MTQQYITWILEQKKANILTPVGLTTALALGLIHFIYK